MIIGRDNLLKKEIYPRIKKKKPFYLVGQRGVGKSTLLRWSFDNYEGLKIFHSCGNSYGAIIRDIAEIQGIENARKKAVAELEQEIIKQSETALFIDDLDRATPKIISLLKVLNELWPVYLCGLEPFREPLKILLWGKQKIKVGPLPVNYRRELATVCVKDTGSLTEVTTIANACRGIPARAWAIARGEAVKDDHERVEGEEINIAPVLLLVMVAILVIRYAGRSLGDKEIYLLGSIFMGMAVFLRYLVFAAVRKT